MSLFVNCPMFQAKFNEFFYTIRFNIVLHDVSRGNHVTSISPKNGNLFNKVFFKLIVASIWQQILLIDSSPKGEYISEIIFHILR